MIHKFAKATCKSNCDFAVKQAVRLILALKAPTWALQPDSWGLQDTKLESVTG